MIIMCTYYVIVLSTILKNIYTLCQDISNNPWIKNSHQHFTKEAKVLTLTEDKNQHSGSGFPNSRTYVPKHETIPTLNRMTSHDWVATIVC